MSDYTNLKSFWSYAQDDNPNDKRPSFLVIGIAILFVLMIIL